MNFANFMDMLSGGRGAPFFVGGEDDDDGEELELDDDDELGHFHHHQHGPGCHHHHDEDTENLLEVLPRFMRKGQPETQLEGEVNEKAEDLKEDEDEDEEGEVMSADEACIFNLPTYFAYLLYLFSTIPFILIFSMLHRFSSYQSPMTLGRYLCAP